MVAEVQPRVDQPAPARGERARFWVLLVLSVLLLAGSVTVVVGLVSPGLEAAAAGREADGARAFELGDGRAAVPADVASGSVGSAGPAAVVTVTPDAGWWVEPHAEGLSLSSPDRALGVEMRVVTEREAREALETAAASGDPLLTETLASGAHVQHVTAGEEFIAATELGETRVLFEAELDGAAEADIADFRVTLARLLESLAAG